MTYIKWRKKYRPQFVLLHQLHASYTLRFLHATLRFYHATLRFLHATLLARYVTLFACYDTLLAHYDTFLARYVTLLTRLHASNTFLSQFEIAWKWLKPEINIELGKEIIMNIYYTE
jgi:hypothetical protein